MPDTNPSNAPDAIEERDRDTAAGVMTDTNTGETPGGGTLIGEGEGGDPVATGAGATANSPIDTGVDSGDAHATEEALNRTTGDTPEPGHESR